MTAGSEPRHFLLTTMFSAGDVVPFVRLGKQLVERGHRVTLVTHAPFRRLAEGAGLAFGTWDTPAEHAELLGDGALFNDISGFTTIYERHVIPKLHREADALRAQCVAGTVLVTRCGPAIAARAVAEQRGATLVEAFLGPGHVSPAEVLSEFARPFRAAIAELRGRDDSVDVWVNACNARFGLWPSWFAGPEPHWPPQLTLVGFIATEAASTSVDPVLAPALAALIAGSGPIILLACGTGRFLTREVVEACARVAHTLGVTMIIVTPFEDLVPTPLPGGVHWFASAPYGALIPQMALVIHHGGIGTLQETLRAGVPQIALGAGGDRPVNARCIERLGVGRYVRPAEWGEQTIASAAQSLLGADDARRTCDEAAAHLRSDEGDGACRFLEALAHESFETAFARDVATASPNRTEAGLGSGPDLARVASLSPAQRALLLKRLRNRDG